MGLNSFALGFNVDFFTCSLTGPSSFSSPLRPTGGLPVWLGQGGRGCSGPSVAPVGARGGLSSFSEPDSVLEETGDPIVSEVNSTSSFSFPLASSFKIRGGKGSMVVSGELLGCSLNWDPNFLSSSK